MNDEEREVPVLCITTNMLALLAEEWDRFNVKVMEITGGCSSSLKGSAKIQQGKYGFISDKIKRDIRINYTCDGGYFNAPSLKDIHEWILKKGIGNATITHLKYMMPLEKETELITLSFTAFSVHTKMMKKIIQNGEKIPNQELYDLLKETKNVIQDENIKRNWQPSALLLDYPNGVEPKKYMFDKEVLGFIRLPFMTMFNTNLKAWNMRELEWEAKWKKSGV